MLNNFLNNYICAVDFGSSKISASLVKIKNSHITAMFFESTTSKGIKNGSLVNSVELTHIIERLLKKLKDKSGINFKVIYGNISGEDIVTKHSHAILPLAERGNKVIALSDIRKVNEQARVLGSSLQEEIIHQIPFSYAIDSKEDILNPLGLYSHRLEVDLYLVCARISGLQSLSRAISQAGYEAKSLFLSGIATAKAVFGKEIVDGTNVFCDIGSDITEILVFKGGLLRNIEILKLGGDDLTAEVSNELKIPFELAEAVKKSHFSIGGGNETEEDREILIKKENIYKPIKQKLVEQILTSKASAMSLTIKKTLEKNMPVSHINNFIISGKVALQDGFLEILENSLGIPVRIGRINYPEIAQFSSGNEALAGQKYLNYITSLGIIAEVLEGEKAPYVPCATLPSGNFFLNAANRAKELYQEYF